MRKIEVYKCKYDYLIFIGNDAYEMDDRPLMPNGVNTYLGNSNTIKINKTDLKMSLKDLPVQVLVAIIKRMELDLN